MFLFALGNHYHRHARIEPLDFGQRVEATDARHILVEKHQVDVAIGQFVEGFAARGYRYDFVALVFKEKDMRFEEVDLVVGPKNSYLVHSIIIALVCYCVIALVCL